LLQDEPVVGPQAMMVSGLISALLVTMHLHWMLRHAEVDQHQNNEDDSSAHTS
jgi:succinate dehydrogenase hydrophobic anchor subunit